RRYTSRIHARVPCHAVCTTPAASSTARMGCGGWTKVRNWIPLTRRHRFSIDHHYVTNNLQLGRTRSPGRWVQSTRVPENSSCSSLKRCGGGIRGFDTPVHRAHEFEANFSDDRGIKVAGNGYRL